MLVTNHVLAGAALGRAVHRPVPAFLLGIASHFAMDAIPHYGTRTDDHTEFMRLAVRDGLTGLATLAAIAVTHDRSTRLAALAGAAGAALPDLDKPYLELVGRRPWPGLVNSFHDRIQSESHTRWPVELAFATLGVAALIAARRRRSR